MTFGEKLQEVRRNNNISQERLAEMLNVSRQSVSKWERDHGYPEIDKLIYMCDIFNVSLDELLRENKSQKSQAPYPQEAEMSDRRPISLVKEPEVKEIYPGNNVPSFDSQVPAAVAGYNNYNASGASQGYYGECSPVKSRRKISARRIVCLVAGSLILGTALCGASFVAIVSKAREENAYCESYDDSDFTYEVSCYTDNKGVYYIIDGDYGIADQIYNNEFGDYIKVRNIETEEEKYIYGNYASKEDGLSQMYKTADGSQSVAIPSYIPQSSVSAEELSSFTVLYNTAENNMPYFVPDYILPEVLRDSHESQGLPDVDDVKNVQNVEKAEDVQAAE